MKIVVSTPPEPETIAIEKCESCCLYMLFQESYPPCFKLHCYGDGCWRWCGMHHCHGSLNGRSHNSFAEALVAGLAAGTVHQFENNKDYADWLKSQ